MDRPWLDYSGNEIQGGGPERATPMPFGINHFKLVPEGFAKTGRRAPQSIQIHVGGADCNADFQLSVKQRAQNAFPMAFSDKVS
jgi:hypothetical protein